MNDAEFKTLVDFQVKMLERCEFDAYELKQAAVLASQIHLERTLTPLYRRLPADD